MRERSDGLACAATVVARSPGLARGSPGWNPAGTLQLTPAFHNPIHRRLVGPEGVWAWQARPVNGANLSARCYTHIGFTLVALVDGFTVVTVLNAGAPGWAVATTGV